MTNPVLLALKEILDSQDHQEAMAMARQEPEKEASRRLLELAGRAEKFFAENHCTKMGQAPRDRVVAVSVPGPREEVRG